MYKVGDGEWSEEIPEATEAGEYTVSYKVVRAEGQGETDVQQLKVTITPAKKDDSKKDGSKGDTGNKSDGKDDTSDTNKNGDTNNTNQNSNTNTTSVTNTNKTSGGTQSTAVKNSTTVSAVKTGDTTDILGYIGAAFIALAAVAGIFFIRKKDR